MEAKVLNMQPITVHLRSNVRSWHGILLCILALPAVAGPSCCDSTSSPDTLSLPLSLLWKTTVANIDQNPQLPCYAGGTLYFAAGSSILAENAADGSVVWTYRGAAAFNTSPAVSGDALYVGSDDDALYKLSLKDGSLVWKQQLSSAIRSSPAVANGRVCFGSNDGNVYALDASSGAKVWTYPAGTAVTTPVAISDRGDVLFVAGDDTLCDLNGDTGQRQWQVPFPDDPTDCPPVFADGVIYVGAGRMLYALSPRRGALVWKLQLADNISAPCAVDGSRIYISTTDDKLTALTGHGTERWSAYLPSRGVTRALPVGNTVFVATEHGVLTALSADNGTMQWQYVVQSTKNVKAVPLLAANTLFALGSDGSLSAFQRQAQDKTGPVITPSIPQAGGLFTGTDIPFTAAVVDEGSGISPKSVTLTVDGKLQTVSYNSAQNGFTKPVTSPTAGLTPAAYSDGTHTATITATDWKGNTTTQTWTFTVDNSAPARQAQSQALINSGKDPSYPYPMPPSTDPATRYQQRQQAQAIWRQLMQDHQKNGGPMPPTPPSY